MLYAQQKDHAMFVYHHTCSKLPLMVQHVFLNVDQDLFPMKKRPDVLNVVNLIIAKNVVKKIQKNVLNVSKTKISGSINLNV